MECKKQKKYLYLEELEHFQHSDASNSNTEANHNLFLRLCLIGKNVSGSFSSWEPTCMHCGCLVLWTCKVLCGSFYTQYIYSVIHLLIFIYPCLSPIPLTVLQQNNWEKMKHIHSYPPPLPPSKTTTLSTSFYHPYLEQMQVGQQSLGLHVTVPVQYQYDFQQLTLGIKKHTNKTNP